MRTSSLEEGRRSFVRRSWGDAYTGFAAANAETPLELDDLEQFALAAHLSGHDEAAADAWTRAHHEAIECNDPQRAAGNAFLIGAGLMFRGEIAPAMGWFGRGERVLEDCEDCAERAWPQTWKALAQMFAGDPQGAAPILMQSTAAGQRFDDIDLVTMSRLGQGMCMVMQGQGGPGTALLDEVMVSVTSDEVSPIFAGIAYCSVIATCSDLFDVRRAREWTAALTRWCDSQPGLVPYRGNCLVHQCEIMRLQGLWGEALQAAEQACDHLSGPVKWDTLGSAYYQLAELQRLRGEFDDAEKNYHKANEAGRSPEPGLALLRLAQGRVDAAAAMMRRAMEETDDPPSKSRLLPAHVEIMIAAGDLPLARTGSQALAQLAEQLDAPYLHAVAAAAAGAVRLAEGDPRSALPKLRVAAAAWRGLDAPHETARVRVLVGLACRALGDSETAAMEFDAARTTFEKLGARPDVERLDTLMARSEGTRPDGLSAREVEVLVLLVSGATNRQIAHELGLAEKTVARHLSNIFTKIGVPSRAAATAYAYQNGLV